jgi:polyphosphate kinase
VKSKSGVKQQQQQQQLQQQQRAQQKQQQFEQAAEALERVQQLKTHYQRSRLQEYYTQHLSRELLLKLNVSSVRQLPIVKNLDLAVSSKDLLGRRYVGCLWQL